MKDTIGLVTLTVAWLAVAPCALAGLTEVGDWGIHQNKPGIAGGAEAYDYFGQVLAVGNFNGDDYEDLAIGVPGEDIGDISNAGAVQVIYGTSSGLTSANDDFWSQSSSIIDEAETGDKFGSSLAAGDFDADGYDDLAIGVPREDLVDKTSTGAVQILYGGPGGLTSTGNQFWHQNSSGIVGSNTSYDNFGHALAAGDFDEDGYDDLAIGIYGKDISGISGAGSVLFIYGTSSGLSSSGNHAIDQNSPGVPNSCENYDYFGLTLASADVNGDDKDDVIVGSPYENIGSYDRAGIVHVLFGSSSGVAGIGSQAYTESSMEGKLKSYAYLGWTIVTGDFTGDGIADVAFSAPYLNGEAEDARQYILYGDTNGTGYADYRDDNWGIVGNAKVITAGDYHGDGYDDMVTGVGVTGGGAQVLYSDGTCPPPCVYGDTWSQDAPVEIEGASEAGDGFGIAGTSGDFNNDGYDDLAIGVPNESLSNISKAGMVNIIYGSPFYRDSAPR